MLKFGLLFVGISAGAAGATAWLLSEPETGARSGTGPAPDPESFEARLEALKSRLREALEEGHRAGRQTEEQLRHRLDGYRRGASVPG